MKKIRTLAVILALILSLASLSACAAVEKLEPITEIGGMEPSLALASALTASDESESIAITLSASCGAEVLGMNLGIAKINDFYTYREKNGNAYSGMHENAEEALKEHTILSALTNIFSGESTYVDGICYQRSEGSKVWYTAETCPFSAPDFSSRVSEITEKNPVSAYRIDGRDAIRVTLSGDDVSFDTNASSEVYTVYFGEDLTIESVEIRVYYTSFFSYSVVAEYTYGDAVSEVFPPEDLDSYTEKAD